MTARRSRGTDNRNRSATRRPVPVDVWHHPGQLPELEPIRRNPQPGALLRSLGDPPMADAGRAEHYLAGVVEHAARVAMALALSAGILAEPDD